MEHTSSGPDYLFFLALFLPISLFVLGLVVGWLLGKERRKQAIAVLLAGSLTVVLGYVGLLTWSPEPVFDMKVEVLQASPSR